MAYPKYNKDNPELLESIVCFADILGFSELIVTSENNGKGDTLLYDLHKILKAQYKEISDLNPNATIKTFTDNIILAYPIFQDGEGQSGSIFMSFIYFQLAMTFHGYFIRGGISQNKYYGDDQFAYGPALIESYNLESKKAIYPRIILSERMVMLVRAHLDYYSTMDWAPQYSHLLCDLEDGQWFINYLYGLYEDYQEKESFERFISLVDCHKKCVEAKLLEFKGNEKILDKYKWVANYHNYFCELYIKGEVLNHTNILIEGFDGSGFSRIMK